MAGRYQLTIYQGATLDQTFTYKDSAGNLVNLTSYTARSQVRKSHQDKTVVLDMTTANGRITLGGAAGTIKLTVTAADTATLPAPLNGVWDLELIDGSSKVTRLLEGPCVISPEVTR